MSGQKSILNFLKPVSSVKRPLCEGNNANFGKSEEPLEKKVKSNVNEVGDKPAVRKEWPNEIIAKIKLTSRRYQALHMSIGHSWFRALEPEFKKDYFMKLSRFLVQERSQKRIFPPEEHVWTWTQRCDISDIKVVILGQDPYHNPGQAHGVLLLNACLTVQCNAANSHRDQGWEQLTDAVIRTLSARNHSLVFLLWGAYAQKKAVIVDKS
ncbi:Uracil-DNA glycosylase [Gryllus bimaculatus]|nr:Uracil-DNA glycosylase [Gryllus bimaculatus]